jgi:hypothetical protein
MEPRGDLPSKGYALAHEGEEYLVLQPSGAAGPAVLYLKRAGGTSWGVGRRSFVERQRRQGALETFVKRHSRSPTEHCPRSPDVE